MFYKEDMEAYKSVKAPGELREKVLMANKNVKSFPYRQLYLAAACLVMTVSLATIWNWKQSVISIEGNEQMLSMASVAREIPKTSISMEISTNHKRKVIVSEGSINGQDSILISSDTELIWQLDADTEKEYSLYVTGWGKDKAYLLTYNQINEHWELKEQ